MPQHTPALHAQLHAQLQSQLQLRRVLCVTAAAWGLRAPRRRAAHRPVWTTLY